MLMFYVYVISVSVRLVRGGGGSVIVAVQLQSHPPRVEGNGKRD